MISSIHESPVGPLTLVSNGVASSRVSSISYGKERPVAICDDISCWSQNRRGVTVLDGAGS